MSREEGDELRAENVELKAKAKKYEDLYIKEKLINDDLMNEMGMAKLRETEAMYIESCNEAFEMEAQLRKCKEVEIPFIQEEYKALLKVKTALEAKLKRQKTISKNLADRQPTEEEKKAIVSEILSPVFTPEQIQCFLRPNWKRGRWGEQDMSFALTLKSISNNAYKFMRKSGKVPLPGVSSLKQYFADFKLNEGYMEHVDILLRNLAESLTEEERVVGLEFDGVHVRRDLSYCNSTDRIIGFHREALVALIRGIFKNYKIPIL